MVTARKWGANVATAQSLRGHHSSQSKSGHSPTSRLVHAGQYARTDLPRAPSSSAPTTPRFAPKSRTFQAHGHVLSRTFVGHYGLGGHHGRPVSGCTLSSQFRLAATAPSSRSAPDSRGTSAEGGPEPEVN